MRSFGVLLFASVVSLSSALTSMAQATGNAALDIDLTSGMVVATCETDLDASVQAFYRAEVKCKVTDASGKEITSSQQVDENGTQGYALVVLTLMGVPGTTYTVTASHEVEAVLQTHPEAVFELLGKTIDFDPFNFGSFDKLHQTYQGMYEWFGSGIGSRR
jgi:hypothetical protein